MHTRYPLSIHFNCSIHASEMTVQNVEKLTKIKLRIISKPHAYLQTMTKTPIKFQKDRHKTVGGVAHTRYLLLEGAEPQKAEYCAPSFFFEKSGDNNRLCPTHMGSFTYNRQSLATQK